MKKTLFLCFVLLLSACTGRKIPGKHWLEKSFTEREVFPGKKAKKTLADGQFFEFWEKDQYDSCLFMLRESHQKTIFSDLNLNLLANDLIGEGRKKDALFVLNKLIRQQGETDESLFLRAGIYFEQGYFGLADRDYAICSKNEIHKGESLYWRGIIHFQLEEYKKAKIYFQQAEEAGDRYATKMLNSYFHEANRSLMGM